MSRGPAVLVVVVVGLGFALGTMHPSGRPAPASRTATVLTGGAGPGGGGGGGGGAGGGGRGASVTAGQAVRRSRAAAGTTAQADPERLDPALAREHRRALGARPVFQHLPYRDREIGVGFDRVAGDGRLELLVTYIGRRAPAAKDFRRLLGRFGDPGTAYVERYERVF